MAQWRHTWWWKISKIAVNSLLVNGWSGTEGLPALPVVSSRSAPHRGLPTRCKPFFIILLLPFLVLKGFVKLMLSKIEFTLFYSWLLYRYSLYLTFCYRYSFVGNLRPAPARLAPRQQPVTGLRAPLRKYDSIYTFSYGDTLFLYYTKCWIYT